MNGTRTRLQWVALLSLGLACGRPPSPTCGEPATSTSTSAHLASPPAASATRVPVRAAQPHVDISVSVARLVLDYRKKPAVADAMYHGKRVRLGGEIREVRRDAPDVPLVVLALRLEHEDGIFDSEAFYDLQMRKIDPAKLPVAELRFEEASARRASNLIAQKPLLVECTVEGFSENVKLTACSFADTSVYDVCRSSTMIFSCILPGWRDPTRVPFYFHWLRNYGGIDDEKIADACVDDGRAPLVSASFDPRHVLSERELHYAGRAIGMIVRAPSLEAYDHALAAMDAEADAGVLGSRYIGSRGARTFVMLPPYFETIDFHETNLRHALEEDLARILDALPVATDEAETEAQHG
jgi:hypothetical protein